MNDLTTSYFSIEKSDKQPDGTLMVYGKATDDSVDIDQQICDAAWLDRAMPAWFKSGGNIREQHSSIAAGVAKEYEPKADGHYIMAHIVDPVSVKKVDAGVLRGFSIGIKSPRVVRDTKAANGRIIDGQIVEVSLVDRPANPNCQLVLAKSVDGESSLIQVEELNEIEKHGSHNQSSHGRRGGAGGVAGGASNQTNADASEVNGSGWSKEDLRALARENFGNSGSRGGLKAGDTLDRIKNAEGVRVKINDNSELRGKKGTVTQSAPSGSFHGVLTDDGKEGYIHGSDLIVVSAEKHAELDIEKHGSHNQSSHGRRGSGGGAGAGGTSAPAKDKVPSAKINRNENALSTSQSKLIDTHAAEARGLADDAQAIAKNDNYVRPAARNLTSAAEHLNNASGAKTIGEAKEGIKRAKIVIERAALNLEDQNYNIEASNAFALSKDLNSMMTGLSNGVIKEVDADLDKHGSHNQSSHGRRGSGGGAGGGAAPTKEQKAKVTAQREKLQELNNKIRSENTKTQTDKKIDEGAKLDAQQGIDDAQFRLDDAKESLEYASNAKTTSDYARGLDDAGENMQAAGRHVFDTAATNSARLAGEDLMIAGAKLQQEAINANKSLDSAKDYRKALQSALHLYSLNKSEEATMDQALVELPVEVVADLLKFDAAQYESARNALARLIEVEAKEMGEGSNEIQSIGHLLQSVMHLTAWYEGEEAEGEVMEQETMIERAAKSYKNMKPAKDEPKPDFMKRCKDAGMDDDAAKACWDKYMSADVDAEKSAEISKCLECGCNQPGSDHGLTTTNDFANVAKPSNVTTAEMYAPGETPKSAEGEDASTVTEEEVKAEEPVTEETPAVETTEVSADEKSTDVEALVEQVVKSATESLKSEIAELVSAKEAALSKAMSLETELELAKSLAVAGGPSRTARPLNVKTTSDLLTKAAIYKAKANATTDPTLAKGYKSLAEEFLNKANEADNK